MREIVFALEFRGRAGPVSGSESKRQARTIAPSQALSTVLESRVERFGDGSFVEDGTIAYGSAGTVAFETIGRGWVAPAPRAGWVVGGVLWTITSGDGVFASARGLITSNFTVSADGEVIDDHFARLYLP